MANPARRLLELFDEWEARDGFAEVQRPLASEDGWGETAEAFECLRDITATLGFMEAQGFNSSLYRENLPSWRGSVMHYGRAWHQSKVSLEGRDGLRALSDVMDVGSVRPVKERLPADFRGLLDEIVDEVRGDETLDPFLQGHVLKLVSHIRALLDEDRAGLGFDLAEALGQLRIYLDAAAERSKTSSKSARFREWSSKLATEVFSGVLTTAATLGVGQLLS